jgi:hypothetical protein
VIQDLKQKAKDKRRKHKEFSMIDYIEKTNEQESK